MRTHIKHSDKAKEITLPAGMTIDQAMNALKMDEEIRKKEDRDVEIEETIERYPFEAALALKAAADELHDTTIPFDRALPNGEVIRAKLVSIPTSLEETIQVPWGPFRLPGIEGYLETNIALEDGALVLEVTGRVKQKYRADVKALVARARKIARGTSIYKGKAIKVRFRNDAFQYDLKPPQFMDLSGDFAAIFSRDIEREIAVNLEVPILHAEEARKLNVPKKRGTLLRGTFGSGKTLTAFMLAKMCEKVGRTFIYVQSAIELPDALLFARAYSPSLVFGEDVDRVTFGPRTAEMDRLFNIVDGVDTKSADIMVVQTTNSIESIHPAFLREGRMDAIIKIDEPDAEAAERLVRLFCGDLLAMDENVFTLARHLAGKTPALIREVVERSKLNLLYSSTHGAKPNGAGYHLSAKDLELSFHRHMEERRGVQEALDEARQAHEMMGQISDLIGHHAARAAGNGRGRPTF
jgi:transitional endoplasmic reticulum ATPase